MDPIQKFQKKPLTKSRPGSHIRTKITLILGLTLVAFTTTECRFEAGLLDKDSDASKKELEMQENRQKAEADKKIFSEHKSDIHYDIVNFVSGICSSINSFRGSVESLPKSDEAKPIDEVITEYTKALAMLSESAYNSAYSISANEIPHLNPILTPGMSEQVWRDIQESTKSAFDTTATSIVGIDYDLQTKNQDGTHDMVSALHQTNESVNTSIEKLNSKLEIALKKIKIPNKETSNVLKETSGCNFSENS